MSLTYAARGQQGLYRTQAHRSGEPQRDALVPSQSFSVSGGGRVEAVADDVREHGGCEQAVDLGGHGTRYVPNARGWYAYPVRRVRRALGQATLRLWYVPSAGGRYT